MSSRALGIGLMVGVTVLAPCLLGLSAPAMAQDDLPVEVDTTFERKTSVSRFWIIYVGGDQSYRMTNKVHGRYQRLWPFMTRGTKIHLVTKKGWVTKLERGWKTRGKTDTEGVIKKIRSCQEGDRVEIDGREHLFLRASETHLTAAPKLPGEAGFGDERKFLITSVREFKILDKRKTTREQDLGPDTLDVFKVAVGDTVAVFLGKEKEPIVGAFSKLGDKAAELREWGPEGWAGSRRLLRRQVTKVRHVPLKRKSSFELRGGDLQVEVEHFRRSVEGPMEIKVSVVHDVPSKIMTGLRLRMNLSEAIGSANTPDAEEISLVPALFAGERHRVTHTVIHSRYSDVLVRPEDAKLLEFSDPEAMPQVLRQIDLGPELGFLTQLYVGVGSTKQPQVIGLLINRALYPPTRAEEVPAEHARAARKGLEAAGQEAVSFILDQVDVSAAKLRLVSLVSGELREDPLPESIPADEHRESLIKLLGRLRGAVSEGTAQRLFDLSVKMPALTKAVERAFAFQPESAAGVLLAEAVPRDGDGFKEREDRANTLLHDLADKVIDLLPPLVAKRGAPVDELRQAIVAYGNDDPGKAVDVALRLAREGVKAQRRQSYENRVKEAKELRKKLEWEKALRLLEEVLKAQPDHKEANALLGPVLVGQANSLSARGYRGDAIDLLESAVKRRQAEAKKPLGRMMLEVLQEECEGVVLRKSPQLGGAKVATVAPATRYPGKSASKKGWIQVDTGSTAAYVREDSARVQNGTVLFNSTAPQSRIEELARRTKELEPNLDAPADKALGTFLAGLAEAEYNKGNYSKAYGLLSERVSELAPNEPRLSLKSRAWLFSNIFMILGTIVVLGGGGGVLYWLIQQEQERRAKNEAGDDSLEIDLFGGQDYGTVDLAPDDMVPYSEDLPAGDGGVNVGPG